MVIQRMNNVLVKHSKILFGLFTAVIIVSFVWFFTPGVDGSVFFGGGTGDKSQYGVFFEEPVTYGDIRTAMRQLSLISFGNEINQDQAFLFAVRKKAADKMGVNVSDKELADAIRGIPYFQENGKFSKAMYENFQRKQLEPMGYSCADYEAALREIIRAEKLSSVVTSNVTLSDAEYDRMLKEKFEKLSFRFIQFIPDTLTGEVKFKEADLKAFFEANKANFLPPVKFSGIAVAALNADYRKPATAAAVKAHYDQNKEQYKDKNGKVKPFNAVKKEIAKALTDADVSGSDEAMKNFRAELIKIRKTDEFKANPEAAFRALAAKMKMKLIPVKDITVETLDGKVDMAIVRSLTTLKNIGSITNAARGEKGIYVTMLTKYDKKNDTTFAEARAKAEIAFRLQKARDLVPAAAAKFRADLAKSKNPAKDLDALAKKHHGNVMKFPADVTRIMLESNPNTAYLRGILFDTPAGKLSVSRKEGGVEVMAFMDARKPADAKELATMKSNAQIREMFLAQKRNSVMLEYEHWIMSNCRITVPTGKAQQAAQ